jgi:hypothetical protein
MDYKEAEDMILSRSQWDQVVFVEAGSKIPETGKNYILFGTGKNLRDWEKQIGAKFTHTKPVKNKLIHYQNHNHKNYTAIPSPKTPGIKKIIKELIQALNNQCIIS